jgi:hypothetical protein
MVNETTWHRDPTEQTTFTWNVTNDGLEIDHNNGNPTYTIPWRIFYAVYVQARTIGNNNDGQVVAGLSRTSPPTGSVGEWVNTQNFNITPGTLTSGHLSFLGPIYGRMGFIQRRLHGNAIIWRIL